MGADFINNAKGSIRKSREKHKSKLSTELIAQIKEVTTILAKPTTTFCFAEGQSFELHITDNGLDVFYDRQLIAKSEIDSPSILDEIKKCGGKALGKLKRIRTHSGRADISVLLNKRKSKNGEK